MSSVADNLPEDETKTDALNAATSEDLWFDPAILDYKPMPRRPTEGDAHLLATPWRIVLEHYTAEKERIPLSFDLYGTMTLGRTSGEGSEGHVDLDPHNAHALGVSRRHSIITRGPGWSVFDGPRQHQWHNGQSYACPTPRQCATQTS